MRPKVRRLRSNDWNGFQRLGLGLVLLALPQTAHSTEVVSSGERCIPGGNYLPFFSPKRAKVEAKQEFSRRPVAVKAFAMAVDPVTNADFLEFVRKNPEWQKSKISRVFADQSYLKHWKSDLILSDLADRQRPVTHVSWFAASAYCESKGQSLPTSDQWEYAADDAGRGVEKIKSMLLEWYATPNSRPLPAVSSAYLNGYGIRGLHGLIWEWSSDFNSTMFGSENRSAGTKDDNLFCGAGSQGSMDASDYAKFMRFSFRASLKADYTTANLGFRCVRGDRCEK